jgi:hypothetical protein
MKRKPETAAFVLFALSTLLPCVAVRADEELIQVRGLIGFRTKISSGELPMEKIAEVLEEKNIPLAVFADRDLVRCEYGIPPFRQFLKKRMIEKKAVFNYGTGKYLNDIENVQEEFPDTIFVPGILSNPYYWWDGTAFRHDLKLRGWHRYMLAMGMDDARDYDTLPVLGNPNGSNHVLDPVMLWPLILLVPGLLLVCRKKPTVTNESEAAHAKRIKEWQKKGAFLVVVAVVIILINWPFTRPEFDQYTEAGGGPFQRFIDDVREKGGLSYWANPESSGSEKMGEIKSETKEYTELLQKTAGYTGFAVFPGGYRKVGAPGGLWDKILNEHCDGSRKDPVWAISVLNFGGGDVRSLTRSLGGRQTVALAAEKSREAFVDALRRGRSYAMSGRSCPGFHLDHFSVSDASGKTTGIVGDTITIAGNAVIRVEGRVAGKSRGMELRIIRNGRMIRRSKEKLPFKVSHEDKPSKKNKITRKKIYYRVEIREHHAHVITNPVFVIRSDAPEPEKKKADEKQPAKKK